MTDTMKKEFTVSGMITALVSNLKKIPKAIPKARVRIQFFGGT